MGKNRKRRRRPVPRLVLPYPIVQLGHPALRARAHDVKPEAIRDGTANAIAVNMVDTMMRSGGVGLAAPQLGMSTRIVVIAPPRGEVTILYNPTLVEQDGADVDREGCLSIAGVLFPEVERPTDVEVRALDRDGNELLFDAQGYEARIVAHELDHLNGRLVCSRGPWPQ